MNKSSPLDQNFKDENSLGFYLSVRTYTLSLKPSKLLILKSYFTLTESQR